MKVKEVMTHDPIVARVPGTRREVLKTLVKSKKTGLPVLDADDKLVGIITRRDFFNHPKEEQLALIMQMNPPIISQNDTIENAAKIIIEHHIIYHIPVLDSKKQLVGVIAPSDLLSIIEERKITSPVGEFISRTCVPVYQETPVSVCANIFEITKVYALPVLDESSKLKGLITDRDVFNLSFVDEKMALSQLGLGNDEDSWTWEGLRNVVRLYYQETKIDLPKIPVKEVMIKDPLSVFDKTPVSDAAREMRKQDFGQLPVRDLEDRLIALIYDFDIVSALI
ncbi:MAG: CBS domain-containing protein [Thermoplasmata archaeon]|nr:MAG: CBS domain-containing protein [Thermoplasmata archaeon]